MPAPVTLQPMRCWLATAAIFAVTETPAPSIELTTERGEYQSQLFPPYPRNDKKNNIRQNGKMEFATEGGFYEEMARMQWSQEIYDQKERRYCRLIE